MRHLSIDTLHSTDADTLLSYDKGIHAIAHAPHIATTAIVACQQHLVDDHSTTKPSAQGDAHQILVSALAPCFLQSLVHTGQGTSQSLTIGKEIAVVVHKHRDAKHTL